MWLNPGCHEFHWSYSEASVPTTGQFTHFHPQDTPPSASQPQDCSAAEPRLCLVSWPRARLTTVLARFGWLGEPLWKGCSNCFTGGVTSCRRRLELLIEAVVWIYEHLKYNSEDKKILIAHPLIHPRYTLPVDLHIGTGLGPLFSPLTWWLQVGITTFCFLSFGNQLKQKLQRINCIFASYFLNEPVGKHHFLNHWSAYRRWASLIWKTSRSNVAKSATF